MNLDDRIVVVGAGVLGLTSAIRLLQKGFSVDIVAREFPPDTTSDVAAAFWCPYRVGPEDRARKWASTTYLEFEKLCAVAETGVEKTRQREVFKSNAPDPWYLDLLDGFAHCDPNDLPEGFVDGYEFDTYRIETSTYMQYLLRTCEALGANMRKDALESLETLIESYDLAVNCSGVWARDLVNDKEVYPIRGQVIVVEKPDTMTKTIVVFDDGETPAYIVPRTNDCLLGGTAQKGNWELSPDAETAVGIRARCESLNPLVSSMKSMNDKVGLRPGRKNVRLEWDDSISGLPVIHNYGHGGSGFTLSWGCADEVVQLLPQ